MTESRVSNITISNVTFLPEEDRVFGFAVCDEDGSDVYIPGRIINKYELCVDDVGEIFEAILVPNRKDATSQYYVLRLKDAPDPLLRALNQSRPEILAYAERFDLPLEDAFKQMLKKDPA